MTLAVVIDVAKIKRLGDNLTSISAETLGNAAVRGLNSAATKVFDVSIKRMLSGVNLTEGYVRKRMDIEPANDPVKPEAVIVAFRSGGRRPATKPVNLIQYATVQLSEPVRWPNSTPQIAKNAWSKNPRATSKWLKWKKRTGAPALGIPVGMKQAGVSAEVIKGNRSTLRNAFIQRMRNGETLVMERVNPNAKGKGKIEALYSLSVWQMFRRTAGQVIPLASELMSQAVGDEVLAEVEKVLK